MGGEGGRKERKNKSSFLDLIDANFRTYSTVSQSIQSHIQIQGKMTQ